MSAESHLMVTPRNAKVSYRALLWELNRFFLRAAEMIMLITLKEVLIFQSVFNQFGGPSNNY